MPQDEKDKKEEPKKDKKEEPKKEEPVEEAEDDGAPVDDAAGNEDEGAVKGLSKKRVRKLAYAAKLRENLSKYKNVLVCSVDFVGSSQMQQVRIALRGQAEIQMGKNTVIRKIIRQEAENNPKLVELVALIEGNIGMVFTNGNLKEIRSVIQANKVAAPAKVGNFAPNDVFVPPGPTGLDPGQTAFFQALNIATKISKGSIEIINRVHLIKQGEQVTPSHVSLLQKLDIKPFEYGIVAVSAYENGSTYSAKVLDMSEQIILDKWFRGVAHVAALSLALGIPTQASIPHSLRNAMKKLIAISIETKYTFEQSKKYKDILADPEAFKKLQAAAAPKAEAKQEPKKEEEEEAEESEGDMGLGLFGDEEGGGGEEAGEEEYDEE